MRMINEAEDKKKVDIPKAIKDLADTNFSKSNEEQAKMVAIFKLLAFSDDKAANKFMTYIDKCATDYSNKSDKKESIIVKGKGELLDMNEAYCVELEKDKEYSIQEVKN